MQKRARFRRMERLEERRHLSAAHPTGCACGGCVTYTAEPAPPAADDFGEAKLAPQLASAGAPEYGPMPFVEQGLLPAGVVGGTATMGRQPLGALTGKTVFTVGGHGFVSFASGWHTQRGEVSGTEMVEDLGTQDQMTFYANYLWNAGATVVPLRPVGYQPAEYVLDNDDAATVTYTGTWSNSSSTIFYGTAGDVPYRFATANATQTATAKYTPNITTAGFYPVYAWTRHGSDRVNQLYKVTHAGGTTDVRVNHRRVGNGYVYLGWYYFNAGTGGYVEISNQSSETGVVIADHIRFGNGMGDIDRGQGVSGQTRSDESALYWIEHQRGQGVSDSQFRGAIDTDDDDNVSAPPRWANWMNREQEGTNTERIFLSYHSNAGGGRGSVGLYNGNNDPSTKTPHQFEWAEMIARETRDDMTAIGAPPLEHAWISRGLTYDRPEFEFGEINNSVILDEFDATILEVAFHDSVQDAELMRDPKVRDWVARASLQATIKYFRQFNNQPTLALPPDSPTNVRAVAQANGDVIVSWAAPVVNSIGGEAATGYVVYGSANGYGFNTGSVVAGGGTLSLTIPAASLNGATYFRVAATNAGGESMVTETVAARAGGPSTPKVLIVQGFDRLGRTQNPTQTTSLSYDPPNNNGSNTFERVRPRFSNSYDYIVRAGEAIKAYPLSVTIDSTSNEALIAGQVSLSGYSAVIWLAGEESTADDTFDATEQSLMTTYLSGGGKLFVSGAEVGFDLDASGGGASFYNNQLKADYVADSAGGYSAAGSAGSIFNGITLTFDDGSQGTYNVNTPDRINVSGGSTVAMTYTSPGSGNAAIQYSSGATRVVNMAFPFETITTSANRNAVMANVLTYFGFGLGSLGGRLFRDPNGNNVQDGGEVSMGAGRTVFFDTDNDGIIDGGETTTTTDANGDFLFSNVASGTYNVRAAFISGHTYSNAPTIVVVQGGGNTTGVNWGFFPTTYSGSGSADTYVLKMDPANNGKVQIIETLGAGSPVTYTIDKTKLFGLTFTTGNGNDVLTVDYTTGSPLPTSGIQFIGAADNDTLTITGSSSADAVTVAGGSVTFGGTISHSFAETLTVNTLGGDDTMNYNGPLTATTFNFSGGASAVADTLNINSGAYTFNADASAATPKLVIDVATGASATFNATQHLEGLSVDGSATLSSGGNKLLVVKSLAVAGSLDLTNNDLILNYTGATQLGTITGLIATGYNGGAWDGNGLVTSLSAAVSGTTTGLAIDEMSSVLGISGSQTGDYQGETVDATSLLIKYTFVGDADLNGELNGDDYFYIDSSILAQVPGYHFGDFDYSGVTDGDDYFWLDSNILAAQGTTL